MQKPQIVIYQDYVQNHGLLLKALQPFGDVHFYDAQDIIAGDLIKNKINLFVMPGGADLYYCEKLNGAGNAAIRDYVEQGGAYLGICAGAYYACTDIIWAQGTTQEIIGPRELNFVQGTAQGPLKEFITDNELTQSWLRGAPIIFNDGHNQFEAHAPYRAGPQLPETGNIIARYAHGAPAIIETVIGQGSVILSSPHIEEIMPAAQNAHYKHNNPHHASEQQKFASLRTHAQNQTRLWNLVMQRLLRITNEALNNAA